MKLHARLRQSILEPLQKKWWESRERMLVEARKELTAERAMHMSQRQWNHELERDVAALKNAIDAIKRDPLRDARAANATAASIFESLIHGPINFYEIRAWLGEYRSRTERGE